MQKPYPIANRNSQKWPNNIHEENYSISWEQCSLSEHQCKLHIVILDFDLQKDNEKFCRPMITCKAMTKILYRNSEKSFLECEKMASRNIFRHFFRANFFMFVLLISNHTVFLVQFEINLHLWVFQKAPNLTRNRMITYTNTFPFCNYSRKLKQLVTRFWPVLYLHLNHEPPFRRFVFEFVPRGP